jgi:hypothetical protein
VKKRGRAADKEKLKADFGEEGEIFGEALIFGKGFGTWIFV